MNMTPRRSFFKKLTAAAAALSISPAMANRFSDVEERHKNSVNDVLRYVSIKDIETFRLQFDKKTPLNWNAIVKSFLLNSLDAFVAELEGVDRHLVALAV